MYVFIRHSDGMYAYARLHKCADYVCTNVYVPLLYLLSYSIFLALFLSQHAKNAFSRFRCTHFPCDVRETNSDLGLKVSKWFRD